MADADHQGSMGSTSEQQVVGVELAEVDASFLHRGPQRFTNVSHNPAVAGGGERVLAVQKGLANCFDAAPVALVRIALAFLERLQSAA